MEDLHIKGSGQEDGVSAGQEDGEFDGRGSIPGKCWSSAWRI